MTELIKTLDLHGRRNIREGEMVISSSLRNRRDRRGPPPPPFARKVTGPLTPNVTGGYCFAGYYNSRAYFKHHILNYFIWYDSSAEPLDYMWRITSALGGFVGPWWSKASMEYESEHGDYFPLSGAAGTAKVKMP